MGRSRDLNEPDSNGSAAQRRLVNLGRRRFKHIVGGHQRAYAGILFVSMPSQLQSAHVSIHPFAVLSINCWS